MIHHTNTGSFFQNMEFHIHRTIRDKCKFQKKLFSSTGNVIISSIHDLYDFTLAYNSALGNGEFGLPVQPEQYLKAGELHAMGLIDEIFHYVCRLYRRDVKSDFFSGGFIYIDKKLKEEKLPGLDTLLLDFCTLFPPAVVYEGTATVEEWYNSIDAESGIENRYLAFEECIMLQLANENPAFHPFLVLFADAELAKLPAYGVFKESINMWSAVNPVFGDEGLPLLELLKAPIQYAPTSLKGQLEYIRAHWSGFLKEILQRLLTGLDILAEEQKAAWTGDGTGAAGGGSPPMDAYHFEELAKEYERFSTDGEWMPNVVMIAKSALVWLDQLSKKYSRSISRLDRIPDEELDFLASAGFNALWLIGIWERSKGSARIKQICGNQEAAASAYSLFEYDIAEELGGWDALAELRGRAGMRGIRLAADMVPNHTGLDSKWIIEKADVFLQTRENPFPSYSFEGENLCHDDRVGVYLENHYYSKTDCAVVFKRVDHHTGDVRYIYHGNDGTGLPWNDTAQIDFLNPTAREAVIQKILHVAHNFPIIRFDAAMVLAKKHIRRLWYPEQGHGGDIASRSRYALSTEEFQSRIPEEFWREVVDRCAAEVSDTLLLAEAFWMMEGYFVRTLGMHRVYNSAFMNMLKKEENAKYRLTIKNTLEFDPEVLKRYVNFMNNPDEETAVAQFGTDDKYFGVCTMMIAMPGLPMFGHGQIDGFSEKYGMEYRRAYYDEEVNTGLVDRHRHEIFPLMKLRPCFSGVENFLLYDFWTDGSVNENVFAWSNAFRGEGSLILFNNKYEQASGWIKMSAAYAVKDSEEKKLIQRSLAEGLQLDPAPNRFMIFQEQRSKQWFIRESIQIAESGLFASLNGFETQVFLHIREVEDTAEGYYRVLCNQLHGAGTADIDKALNDLRFKELYAALAEAACSAYFERIEQYVQNVKTIDATKLEKTIDVLIKENEPTSRIYFSALDSAFRTYVKEERSENSDIEKRLKKGVKTQGAERALLKLFNGRLYRFLYSLTNAETFAEVVQTPKKKKVFPNGVNPRAFIEKFRSSSEALSAYAAALFLFSADDILQYYGIKTERGKCMPPWNLFEKLADIAEGNGWSFKGYREVLNTVQFLPFIHGVKGKKAEKRTAVLKALTELPAFKQYLDIHEWQGVRWFNKERSEQFAEAAVSLFFIFCAKPSKKNADVTAMQNMAVKDAAVCSSLLSEVIECIVKSGYQLPVFEKYFVGKR